MMQKIVLALVFVGLWGCSVAPKEEAPRVLMPPHLALQSESGEALGWGFPVASGVLVTPDHLFDAERGLYWKGERLQVHLRDYEYDVLLFGLGNWLEGAALMADTPPAVGERVYWLEGGEVKLSSVLEVGIDFEVRGERKKNLMALEGVALPGDSGSPVFRADGTVVGMVVGADQVLERSYAVRSDVILDLVRVHQDVK